MYLTVHLTRRDAAAAIGLQTDTAIGLHTAAIGLQTDAISTAADRAADLLVGDRAGGRMGDRGTPEHAAAAAGRAVLGF